MRVLRKSDKGDPVMVLQTLLSNSGFLVGTTGNFDEITKSNVLDFQSKYGLEPDGIVGDLTWTELFKKGYNFSFGTKQYPLSKNEFFEEVYHKTTIYLHHTAGDYRPDYTIAWWENDNNPGKLRRVGTSFVIGRRSTDGNTDFDGVTYRSFPEFYWAHHLGIKSSFLPNKEITNRYLNASSIGIELCSFGPLEKDTDDRFYFKLSNGKKRFIEREDVCSLGYEWRGNTFFQKYTDSQLKECKRLLLTLGFVFDIQFPHTTYNEKWFNLNEDALNGKPGLWTHCNVRYDKTDCFPQPELIEMLNTLHWESKKFIPSLESLESLEESVEKLRIDKKIVKNYSQDLNDID